MKKKNLIFILKLTIFIIIFGVFISLGKNYLSSGYLKTEDNKSQQKTISKNFISLSISSIECSINKLITSITHANPRIIYEDIRKILSKKPKYDPYGNHNDPKDDEKYIEAFIAWDRGKTDILPGYDKYLMNANDFDRIKRKIGKETPYEGTLEVMNFYKGVKDRTVIEAIEEPIKLPPSSYDSPYFVIPKKEKRIPNVRGLVIISSPGGRYEGVYMFINLIEYSRVPVDTYIPNQAKSAAALMFLAGENRIMNEDATIMFHPANRGVYTDYGTFYITTLDVLSVKILGYLLPWFTRSWNWTLQKKLIKEGKWKEVRDGFQMFDDGGGPWLDDVSYVASRIGKSEEFVKTNILRTGEDIVLTAAQALKLGIATAVIERSADNKCFEMIESMFSYNKTGTPSEKNVDQIVSNFFNYLHEKKQTNEFEEQKFIKLDIEALF